MLSNYKLMGLDERKRKQKKENPKTPNSGPNSEKEEKFFLFHFLYRLIIINF